MRIAVSGSHATGKSTLIAAFLAQRPDYQHEPEAFEALADDVELTAGEGPTEEGLRTLLEHTLATVALHPPGARVVFERSPVDYLAYAAASRSSWPRGALASFLAELVPRVRASVRSLDLIAFLPVSPQGPPGRPGESPRFRRRVDEALRRALLDDEHDLFGGPGSPGIVVLPPLPAQQLSELIRRVADRS